jgi:hypothetical protein
LTSPFIPACRIRRDGPYDRPDCTCSTEPVMNDSTRAV